MLIIGVDNGNAQTKTVHSSFVSGLKWHGTVEPSFKDNLICCNGVYVSRTKERVPYQRNKTGTDSMFILTLFAVADELLQRNVPLDRVNDIVLAIGLPPEHFGSLREEYQRYFLSKGQDVGFQYYVNGRRYNIRIHIQDVKVFVQGYSASLTSSLDVQTFAQYYIVDIGGYTLDTLQVDGGYPDSAHCRTESFGIISLIGDLHSAIESQFGLDYAERQIELALQQEKVLMPANVLELIETYTQQRVNDIIGRLVEVGVRIDTTPALFIGGGSVLLKRFIEKCPQLPKIGFVCDVSANAAGYEMLAHAMLRRQNGR